MLCRTQTTAPLLSLAPTLHHLSTSLTIPSSPTNPLFPSPTPTPFALPLHSPPAALLERTATSLGLEVFRETVEDNTQTTFASLPGSTSSSSSLPVPIITKEALILGGKALSIELELVESSEDQGNWVLAKIRCSITLDEVNHLLEHVDALLEPTLRTLLELMRPPKEGEEQWGKLVDGETRELRAARQLKEFERRLREVVRLEAGGKQGNLLLRGEEIRTGVDSWLRAKGCDPSNWWVRIVAPSRRKWNCSRLTSSSFLSTAPSLHHPTLTLPTSSLHRLPLRQDPPLTNKSFTSSQPRRLRSLLVVFLRNSSL